MDSTWVLSCVKCSQAEALLRNVDQLEIAESLDATFHLSELESMGFPGPKEDHNDAFISWVMRHKDHGEIIYIDEVHLRRP